MARFAFSAPAVGVGPCSVRCPVARSVARSVIRSGAAVSRPSLRPVRLGRKGDFRAEGFGPVSLRDRAGGGGSFPRLLPAPFSLGSDFIENARGNLRLQSREESRAFY